MGIKENFIIKVPRERNLNVGGIIVINNFLGVVKTKPHSHVVNNAQQVTWRPHA